mmetsp:Transcript_32487/g.74238  ORF Transcript_32487/g.74238 Transcript_32487/m.74238 type:complete len:297 (-) Transcript_32487:934-1824(-)
MGRRSWHPICYLILRLFSSAMFAIETGTEAFAATFDLHIESWRHVAQQHSPDPITQSAKAVFQGLVLMQVGLLSRLALGILRTEHSIGHDCEQDIHCNKHEHDIKEENQEGTIQWSDVVHRHQLHISQICPAQVNHSSSQSRQLQDLGTKSYVVAHRKANEGYEKHNQERHQQSGGVSDHQHQLLHEGKVSQVLHALHPQQHRVEGVQQLHHLNIFRERKEICEGIPVLQLPLPNFQINSSNPYEYAHSEASQQQCHVDPVHDVPYIGKVTKALEFDLPYLFIHVPANEQHHNEHP